MMNNQCRAYARNFLDGYKNNTVLGDIFDTIISPNPLRGW